eukprot:1144997-Pelagomonas_calceolata.AAC.1
MHKLGKERQNSIACHFMPVHAALSSIFECNLSSASFSHIAAAAAAAAGAARLPTLHLFVMHMERTDVL